MHNKLIKAIICIAILLSVAALSASFKLPRTAPTKLPPSYAKSSVLLVPLDSRPVCSSLPQKLGQLAGLNVILPPKAYLDNYKTPANKEKILQWLQINKKYYPYSIISADMLLHGSLLEARQRIATPAEETALLGKLATLTKSQDEKPVTIFSVIPRLLVSDELLPDRWYAYQLLRYSEYSDLVRITGSFALTQKMRQTEKKIPPEVLQKYISQYQQSDRFNLGLLALAKKTPNTKLTFGQDDASPFGLPHASAQKIKAAIYSKKLQNKAQLTYGADEIVALLIARCFLQQADWQPKIYLAYASTQTEQSVMPYMATTTANALANQLALLGAQQVAAPENADIVCYINCGTDKNPPGKNQAQEVQKLLEAGYKVAIIDSSEDYEPQQLLLPQLLKYNVPINRLAAYAGWNTFSNSSGTALAQAVIFAARLRQLQQAGADSKEIIALYAQNLNFTLERILEDYYYQKTIHPALRQQLIAFGNDPTKLDETEKQAAQSYIQSKLALNAFTLLHTNLGRTPFYSDGGKEYYLKSLAVSSSLPWNRVFEVDLDVWTNVGVK